MFWDVPWLCHTELAPLGTPAAAQSVGGQLDYTLGTSEPLKQKTELSR